MHIVDNCLRIAFKSRKASFDLCINYPQEATPLKLSTKQPTYEQPVYDYAQAVVHKVLKL